MITLIGKVVLITGGSRGIGAAIASMMSEAGAATAFTYHADKASAQRVAHKIARNGSDCLIIQADASKAADVKRTVKAVLDHFGRVDILVNNAGIWKRGRMGKMTEAQWDETIDLNLKGTFLFTNHVVPVMRKQKGGKIINIASTAGQRGEPFYSHYAASKGGIIAFTKALGAELAPENIIVNCVSPGWVHTDMTAHVLRDSRQRREIKKLIPRGRVGTPDEIAGAVLFLASDLSNHIVGATINVNGGSVLFG